jgi:glutamate-5-semialdehyde dehydrogenase
MEQSYTPIFVAARQAGRALAQVRGAVIDAVLTDLAGELVSHSAELLAANAQDLARMEPTDPKYDRLRLTEARLAGIAADLRQLAALPSPLGRVLEARTLPNGLEISKVAVPLGVVGVVYEARPNVTFDVFAICFKTGNACLLKGGSDAELSNQAGVRLIHHVLARHGVPAAAATLLPTPRQATEALLGATGYVDVIIPRGSQALIDYVRAQARVPVIETGAGIVHTYIDASADLAKAADIVFNAKTRRVSVCNALDCLLVHRERLADLPQLVGRLAQQQVVLFADQAAHRQLVGHYPAGWLHPAEPEHFGTEFLDYKLAIKTVDGIDQAMRHIAQHGSQHSEAIVAEDPAAIDQFLHGVDAAAVYANASTAFTDGAQFGLGAEIGISTQKLHARGPMGLAEMTSYKWLVRGSGQVRG